MGFALLLLAACHQENEPTCEITTTTLADDEALPDLDVTVADLFADVAGERVITVEVLDRGGAVQDVADVSVTTTRADGDATWSEPEWVDHKTWALGPGYVGGVSYVCYGGLDVPASLDIARADGESALSADAHLTAKPDELARDELAVSGDVTTTDGDWSDDTSAYAGYSAGELTRLQVHADWRVMMDWP